MIDKSLSGTYECHKITSIFVPVFVGFLKNKLKEGNLSAFVCQRETCPVVTTNNSQGQKYPL